jgi:hypothetical protein
MYRTLIAAAAFAAISLGTANVSHAQQFSLPTWGAQIQTQTQVAPASEPTPGTDLLGQPTGEEREGETANANDRYWVWVNGGCWSRWVYVGNNWWGWPVYRRYVWCR